MNIKGDLEGGIFPGYKKKGVMVKENIGMTLYLLLLIVFLIGCETVNEGRILPEGGKVLSNIN